MDSPVDMLYDDVLAIVAGHLVSPHDYYALARAARRFHTLLLVARPELRRRMTLMYFRPWKRAVATPDGLPVVPVRTPELLLAVVARFPTVLVSLNVRELTEALVFTALSALQSCSVVENVFRKAPVWLRSERVCRLAVKLNWRLYRAVPPTLTHDPAFRLFAAQTNGCVLKWFANNTETAEVVEAAVRSDGRALEHVRDKRLLTPALYAMAVNHSPGMLQWVPEEFRTFDMYCGAARARPDVMYDVCTHCQAAVWAWAVVAIPHVLQYAAVQPDALCRLAVQTNWHNYRNIRNPTMAHWAIRQEGFLKDFPSGRCDDPFDTDAVARPPVTDVTPQRPKMAVLIRCQTCLKR